MTLKMSLITFLIIFSDYNFYDSLCMHEIPLYYSIFSNQLFLQDLVSFVQLNAENTIYKRFSWSKSHSWA